MEILQGREVLGRLESLTNCLLRDRPVRVALLQPELSARRWRLLRFQAFAFGLIGWCGDHGPPPRPTGRTVFQPPRRAGALATPWRLLLSMTNSLVATGPPRARGLQALDLLLFGVLPAVAIVAPRHSAPGVLPTPGVGPSDWRILDHFERAATHTLTANVSGPQFQSKVPFSFSLGL